MEAVTGKSLKDHKWSFPTAVALKATGVILSGISDIGRIPVVGILGSALKTGASLFEKDIHDYHKETEAHFEKLDKAIKISNGATKEALHNLSLTAISSKKYILAYTQQIESQIILRINSILENVEDI